MNQYNLPRVLRHLADLHERLTKSPAYATPTVRSQTLHDVIDAMQLSPVETYRFITYVMVGAAFARPEVFVLRVAAALNRVAQ